MSSHTHATYDIFRCTIHKSQNYSDLDDKGVNEIINPWINMFLR